MLEFKTERARQPVKIDGRKLVLCEITGAEADRYETSLVSIDEDGKPHINRDNVKAKLVQVCLQTEDGKPAYATVAEVGGLPSKALNKLYDEARKMNGLDDNAVERGKKG